MEIHDKHRGTVLKGAEWLDSIRPNWRELVNVNTLSMSSAHFCVLGQAFKAEADRQFYYGHTSASGFTYAVETYGTYRTCSACDSCEDTPHIECGYEMPDWASAHGFNHRADMSYGVLFDLWHEVLTGTLTSYAAAAAV